MLSDAQQSVIEAAETTLSLEQQLHGPLNHEAWRAAELTPDRMRLSPLTRLRAVVLLGGTLRPTALRAAVGRSILDLPVETGCSLLDCWREQCIALAQTLQVRGLTVRLILDRSTAEPHHGWAADQRILMAVERDPVEYRGTGGVLRDLAESYSADDYLLVANAAQILRVPLPVLAGELAATDADLAVISHADGAPSGLMLVRAGCLAGIPDMGFVDLKEQALPVIAKRHRVQVVELSKSSGLPVRTLGDYIEALRRHHLDRTGRSESAQLESCESVFSLVENPADVHRQAHVHNSVVLAGGRVEHAAVVVGSVVCAGAVVARGRMAVDQIVTPARKR